MRLHSPFAPAQLFALPETCVQVELLVGVDEDLQSLRTATTTAEQGDAHGTAQRVPANAERT
jgi:hypothetical protein